MPARSNPRRSNGWRRDQLRRRVLAAYDVCAICGRPVDKTLRTPHPLSAEVDEIVPVSRGGDPLSFANCRLTHRRCNRLKSNKSDAWARMRLGGPSSARPTGLPLETSGDW
ncbi:HNH endonuclease signature motif containing protein [Bifidobacterium phasiani]|uniref:HNH endonuclease n=1 Tax=Bifidobacterium phasiani TaxID=2834431 RepID=A0ABS6W737_9BIFI|nr:HNH endonuclease signature motif containing protein [Bifidobacterium phasiani]MBW3081980.1 HNH endonuclease [Bifidobacterium phasiani]